LTRRGSIFTARQEFYSALRVLAQSNDSLSRTNHYSASLRDGILALKEAEDFMVNDAETRIGLNVSHVIETHQSGLVTADEAQYVNPAEAMQRYFAFAEQQLEIATGNNVVAAEALYCLGKLHTSVAQHKPSAGRLDLAKAIVYHRAALASDQNNHRSANELGVLLARSGQLHDAKDLLKKSLLINPTPQSWQNLTKVHLRLGEQEMARLAHSEYQLALKQKAKGGIQWMPAQSFNASAPHGFHEPVASQAKADPNLRPENKDNDEKPKSLGERLKDLF
jgi:tetratricopeptide (TPR) repeat protein